MDYEIRVTKSTQAETPAAPRQLAATVASSNGSAIGGAGSENIRTQPLGINKRKVLSAHAARPENFYSLDETVRTTGLTLQQVRSVIVDAVHRTEVVRQTTGGIHRFRITTRGLNRLAQDAGNQNTQVSHVGNAA